MVGICALIDELLTVKLQGVASALFAESSFNKFSWQEFKHLEHIARHIARQCEQRKKINKI